MQHIPTFERNDEEKFVSAAKFPNKPKKYWTGQEEREQYHQSGQLFLTSVFTCSPTQGNSDHTQKTNPEYARRYFLF